MSEKAMVPHSSTLAWKIPWTEEPGRLWSMGSRRVGHDWVTSLSLFTFMHSRRKWQPTPVSLPGESQEQGSLVGCRLWGCTELDTTEATQQQQQQQQQSCLTLWDPMDCSLPGPSVHGILQARTLEWVAMPSSRVSSRPSDQTCISYISRVGRWVLYH